MSDPIEPGLIDRLQAQYPGVDVFSHAMNVREMADRRGVDNPNGLLVTWARRDADAQGERMRQIREMTVDVQKRYAEAHVEIYRLLVVHRLSPDLLADLLALTAESGFPRLNPRTVARLRCMGARWPTEP